VFPAARPDSTPRACRTSTRHDRAGDLRDAADLRLPGAPSKLVPLAAKRCPSSPTAARPTRSSSGRHVLHARSRIQGQRRELVADDYVYSLKRLMDPKLRSPGVAARRQDRRPRRGGGGAKKSGKFDYDARVAGSSGGSLHAAHSPQEHRLQLSQILAHEPTSAVAAK